ncbi:MAG: hypothetical protein AB8H80_20635, partial [Planctomycetota bacterium]
MGKRPHWWGIPGALVVLAGVLWLASGRERHESGEHSGRDAARKAVDTVVGGAAKRSSFGGGGGGGAMLDNARLQSPSDAVRALDAGAQRPRQRQRPPPAAAGKPEASKTLRVAWSKLADQLRVTAPQTLVLRLPPEFAGKRADVTLWRRLAGVRESKPWIEMRPRIRPDGSLPMAGIVAGRYDVQVRSLAAQIVRAT